MKLALGILSIFALFMASCSPEASKQYVKPHLEKTQIAEDPNVQYFDPTVDVLFVVDSSLSMNQHQTNMATNISMFTNEFVKNSVLKFNVGVITTDADQCWAPPCESAGYLVGSTYKVVSNGTPNANSVLASNIMVGVSGSGDERSFDPIMMAFAPTMQAGANAGFLRPSAFLAIVFLTDAEDHSINYTAQKLYDELVKLKNGDAKKVLAYGAIIPSGIINCTRDETNVEPKKIELFLGLVANGKKGTNLFNLCDVNFGTKLAGLAKDIVNQVGNIFYLERMPDVNTIRVTYGAMVLPMDAKKGWMFDPTRNAVILGDEIDWSSQPSGSRVMVDYEAAVTDTRPNP